MSQSSIERGRTERWVGFIILLCLVGIAAGVYHKQFSFTPPCSSPPAATPLQLRQTRRVRSPMILCHPAAELSALSAPETFTADNLYDKVDGKADLYLTAGFVACKCQRPGA